MERPLTLLTSAGPRRAIADLSAIYPRLEALVAANGTPHLWGRPEGFPTLARIVLEQQVSLNSASAASGNLEAATGIVTPAPLSRLDDTTLRAIGFSRQKAAHCRVFRKPSEMAMLISSDWELSTMAWCDKPAPGYGEANWSAETWRPWRSAIARVSGMPTFRDGAAPRPCHSHGPYSRWVG